MKTSLMMNLLLKLINLKIIIKLTLLLKNLMPETQNTIKLMEIRDFQENSAKEALLQLVKSKQEVNRDQGEEHCKQQVDRTQELSNFTYQIFQNIRTTH